MIIQSLSAKDDLATGLLSTVHPVHHCTVSGRTGLLVGALAFGCSLYLAQPAQADVIIIVDTAADVIANDGACSLREAITAANNNGNYFGCIGSGGGYDLIEFSLGGGTPVINVASALPAVTGSVEINGGSNRVELRGNGLTSAGLYVSGSGTAGSIIRNMVINGFSTGISLASTTNIVIGGNCLGTSANGTTTTRAESVSICLAPPRRSGASMALPRVVPAQATAT